MSSASRASLLFGRFTSGLLAQALTSFNVLSLKQLNYVSLVSVCIAFVFSLFLPKVKTSLYFHKSSDNQETHRSFYRVMVILMRDALKAFSNQYVLKWSIWAWLSTCINIQVGNYIQALWIEILPPDQHNVTSTVSMAAVTSEPGQIS